MTTATRQRPEAATLLLTAAASATASPSQRTITGLAVPFGPVGHSSVGAITFAKGSLAWSQVGRVKLLEQHDPDRVIGYATDLVETDEGLQATFAVPESPEGDRALAMAADGRRDGLSVGVMLTADVLDQVFEKLWDGDDSPTAAAGQLLETSLVSIPAFDDARTSGSAAAAAGQHVTLSVRFDHGAPAPAPKENTMTAPAQAAAPATAGAPVPTPTPEIPAPAPAPRAAAGAATQVDDAPVYTFDGRGPSFVRDVFNARFSLDPEAQERLQKFNAAMLSGDPGQVGRVTAAVETRTTAPNFIDQGYAPNLLVEAIDRGRPLTSRIGTVNLTDATPFRIPVEGDYTGVGDHTEGTAHVTEGDMTLSDVTVTPGAVSGAYRISRELVDASNPAVDVVALRAMLRDYRKVTEAKVVAALLAADSSATLNINTVLELRAELNNFYDVNGEAADFVASSTSFYATLLADVDTTGRPHLASINPQNAVGEARPGWTGANVDGTEILKSASVAATDAFLVRAEDVFIGESAVQTFRFDEVEGPGIIKLALWSYFAAKVTRNSGIVQVTSAAA